MQSATGCACADGVYTGSARVHGLTSPTPISITTVTMYLHDPSQSKRGSEFPARQRHTTMQVRMNTVAAGACTCLGPVLKYPAALGACTRLQTKQYTALGLTTDVSQISPLYVSPFGSLPVVCSRSWHVKHWQTPCAHPHLRKDRCTSQCFTCPLSLVVVRLLP